MAQQSHRRAALPLPSADVVSSVCCAALCCVACSAMRWGRLTDSQKESWVAKAEAGKLSSAEAADGGEEEDEDTSE